MGPGARVLVRQVPVGVGDRVDPVVARNQAARYDAVLISALTPATLSPLVTRIQDILWRETAGARAGDSAPGWSPRTPKLFD